MTTRLRLLSIGGISLLRYRTELNDELSYSGSAKSVRPLNAIEDIVRDSKWRGQKNRKGTLEVYLADDSKQKSQDFSQYLKSSIGHPLPVVAAVITDNMYRTNGGCCCGRLNCLQQVSGCSKTCCKLVHALAVVTKVPEPKQKDYPDVPSLKISFDVMTYWTTLDYLLWRHRGVYQQEVSIPQAAPDLDFEEDYPTCAHLLQGCTNCTDLFVPVQYNDYSFMFDPEYMTKSIYGGDCGCEVGNDCCGGNTGFASTYSPSGYGESIRIQSKFFNAPPKPLYVFEGITGTSNIYTGVTSSNSGIVRDTTKSTILVEKTNELLVAQGYTALDENDKIAVGDFVYNNNGNVLRNGLIVKNGTIINDVQPVVSSTGSFYGYGEAAPDLKYFTIGSFQFAHVRYLFRRA